ncbi:MAG: hypothetical protein IKX63_08065, partial [Muribaculaceae bacterium]|nr:hypothetical protein [Muribaculaceae bacterium]
MKKLVLLLFAISIATLTFAQQRSITPGAGETWWGYFTESDANAANFSGYGVNAVANYEAAIKIAKNDPIMGNATVKAMRIWLNGTTIPKITSLKIWVTKSLKINAQGVLYVQDVDLSTLTAGANDIALTTPFEINNVVSYFGFTMTLSSKDNAVMNGGEYEANSFFFRATSGSNTSWGQVSDHGKLALQLLAEGVQLPQNNAIVTTKDLVNYNCQIGDDAIIPVTIKNKGKNPITSISYTITSNNDPTTVTSEVTVPINNVTTGNTGTFNVSFDTSEAIKSTKAITVTKVNGVENEATAADATASVQLIIRTSLMFEKVPVVEEFTGTWCGWCPRGFVGMETAHQLYGDKVVLIAAHNGDPMQVSDYSPIMSLNSLGYPNSFIDRKYKDVDPGPTDLQSNINPLLQERPDAKIEISAKWNDAAMTEIDVETNSMFVYNEENANYGVALA